MNNIRMYKYTNVFELIIKLVYQESSEYNEYQHIKVMFMII